MEMHTNRCASSFFRRSLAYDYCAERKAVWEPCDYGAERGNMEEGKCDYGTVRSGGRGTVRLRCGTMCVIEGNRLCAIMVRNVVVEVTCYYGAER